MKMMVAILRDEDTVSISNKMVDMGFNVTRIASTGGFLRQGRSTLMVGLEDEYVDQAIQAINEICVPTIEPYLRRATIFILDVEYFEIL